LRNWAGVSCAVIGGNDEDGVAACLEELCA
jgi:hypothetical protein